MKPPPAWPNQEGPDGLGAGTATCWPNRARNGQRNGSFVQMGAWRAPITCADWNYFKAGATNGGPGPIDQNAPQGRRSDGLIASVPSPLANLSIY